MCYFPYYLRIVIEIFNYVSSFLNLIIMALFVLSPSDSQYLIDVDGIPGASHINMFTHVRPMRSPLFLYFPCL